MLAVIVVQLRKAQLAITVLKVWTSSPHLWSALRYGYAVLIRTERYRPWLIISEIVSHGLEGTIFTDQHFYFHLENMWVINLIKI